MARVEVHSGTVSDGRIAQLNVQMHGLPPRTIDRETALSWMKDGHSFIPVVDGQDQPALRLVEIAEGDDVHHVIRADGARDDGDQLPF